MVAAIISTVPDGVDNHPSGATNPDMHSGQGNSNLCPNEGAGLQVLDRDARAG